MGCEVVNASREGSPASLGSLFQCFVTLKVNSLIFSPYVYLEPFVLQFVSLPFVLSLDTTEKRLAPCILVQTAFKPLLCFTALAGSVAY